MATTWEGFLKNHKDNNDYNKEALEVVELCKPKGGKNQAFAKLTEVQPLVVVSKIAVGGAAQYLLNFFKMRISILKREIKYVTMIGFGRRATTVSVDPNALFKFLVIKKNIPPFKDLLQAESEEDFKDLKRKNTWKKRATPQHTILIPILLEIILDAPEMTPEKFLSMAMTVFVYGWRGQGIRTT